MPNLSHFALGKFVVSDLQAPNDPSLAPEVQKTATTMTVNIILPTDDADGSALTGLAELTVAYWVDDGSADPTTVDEALAIAGVKVVETPLTPADAGTTKAVDLSVGLTPYKYAAWLSD